jgi:hypothetical protein
MNRTFFILSIVAAGMIWNAAGAAAIDSDSPVPPPSARGGMYTKPSKSELRNLLSPLQFRVI